MKTLLLTCLFICTFTSYSYGIKVYCPSSIYCIVQGDCNYSEPTGVPLTTQTKPTKTGNYLFKEAQIYSNTLVGCIYFLSDGTEEALGAMGNYFFYPDHNEGGNLWKNKYNYFQCTSPFPSSCTFLATKTLPPSLKKS